MLQNLNSKKSYLLLACLISIQFVCYTYYKYLFIEPQSIHAWRQMDCLSFAYNFFSGRATFFHPCLNNLDTSGVGRAASEFPLIQYLIAQLWKLTAVSTALFRIVNLLFVMLGIFYIYRIFLYFSKQYYLAVFSAAIFASAPILAYYGITPLSDIQGLSLGSCGSYYLLRWLDENKNKHLIFGLVAFTFAGLFKLSAAFIYCTLLGFFILSLLIPIKKYGATPTHKWPQLIWFAFPFLLWYVWYSYVQYYNQIYNNGFFLIGILPIWNMSAANITKVAACLWKDTLPAWFHWPLLLVIFISAFIILLKNRKSLLQDPFYLQLALPFVAFFFYLLLFFAVFDVHDYYLLNMLLVLVIVWALLLKYCTLNFPVFLQSLSCKSLLVAATIYCTLYAACFVNSRLGFHSVIKPQLLLGKRHAALFSWFASDDKLHWSVLQEKHFDLKNYGVANDATILCLGDFTINRSLYLIKRLGYTNFNIPANNFAQFIIEKKQSGLNYILILDAEYLKNKDLKPFLTNKVFQKNNTSLYKL